MKEKKIGTLALLTFRVFFLEGRQERALAFPLPPFPQRAFIDFAMGRRAVALSLVLALCW